MTYRFDDVEIDAEGFRVTKAGESVRLEPKALEMLLFLVANADRLVTKAEIQEAVWKDTFVTENALTRLVAQIRKGLGDDARDARYIETVPTRGYRFVASLEPGRNGSRPAAAIVEPGLEWRPRWGSGRRAAAAGTVLLALVLAGLAFRSWSARPSITVLTPVGPASRAVERQISTSADLNVFPGFSPDGSSIAFSTLRKGSMEIVARALAPGAAEATLTSDGMQNVQPAFSPDGRLIAFHSVGRGGIWLIPALGGVARPLVSFGSNPTWSPDGSLIAFQSQGWVGSGENTTAAGEGSTLWLVPSAGGEPRPLTSIEEVGPGGQGAPAWSPDGRLISFVVGMRAFAVRRDGSGLRQTSRAHWVNGIAWEKSGRSQVWTGSLAGNWFVWRVPVSPDSGQPTGEPEVLASGGEMASAWAQPTLSPDGKAIAYVTFRTRYEILAQKVTPSGRPTEGPLPLVSGIAGRKVPLGFSPDGRRLAFGTIRPGVGRSLWVVDLRSGETRLVAEQPGLYWSRNWFPDGRRVGYLAPGKEGRSFWSIDVDTGETQEHRPIDADISWLPLLSPDGKSVVSHGARKGGLNVWVMELAGGPGRLLTNDAEGIGWPVWSPDGTRIGVEIMRRADSRVGWVPAGGGPVHEIVSTPGQNWPHSFSPDGRRIALAGQRRGIWNVYWVPLDGGDEQRVTSYDSPAVYVRSPDWSPLGDRIAYEHAESVSTVWMTDLPSVRAPR